MALPIQGHSHVPEPLGLSSGGDDGTAHGPLGALWDDGAWAPGPIGILWDRPSQPPVSGTVIKAASLNYAELNGILQGLRPPLTDPIVTSRLVPCLVEAWLNDYGRVTRDYDVAETKDQGFSYLFDISAERLIAAWGLSEGKDASPRAIIATRMKGHPLRNSVGGKRYHRGHAVPHTMGGRTDINLVPQLGVINSGPFQKLERLAVATPGSLYFTYWSYPDARAQRPSGVEQGCLIAGSISNIVNFRN